MNEKRENIISSLVGDSIKFVLSTAVFIAITVIVVVILFAPFFSPYFKGKFGERYGYGTSQFKTRMFFTYFILFSISISAWFLILYTYYAPKTGCGFQ